MGRWRERVGFGALRVAMGIGAVLPRGMALVLFSAGGALFHAIEGRGRERAVRNLRSVYGANGGARRLARRVYRDLARNAVDLARLERMGGAEVARLVEVSGFDRIEEALSAGRGVVGVTAHLGNWELLAAYLGGRGIGLTVVAASLFDGRLDERLARLRKRHGVRTVIRGRAGWLRKTLGALARGEMIGLLMDLRCRGGGVATGFLGRPALSSVGPVRLAERSGAVLLPMACWRVGGDRYRIAVDRPIDLFTADGKRSGVEERTNRCVRALERYIHGAPTQWVWMHDRWGTGAA